MVSLLIDESDRARMRCTLGGVLGGTVSEAVHSVGEQDGSSDFEQTFAVGNSPGGLKERGGQVALFVGFHAGIRERAARIGIKTGGRVVWWRIRKLDTHQRS